MYEENENHLHDGPNADNRDTLKQLALHGMDVARFNFSHGDHEEQKGRLELLKSVREELDLRSPRF